MIVSVNPTPSLGEFKSLMTRTDALLNQDALARPKYYAKRGGNPLEEDVKAALDECAKGTPFANTIELISGHKFPDIIAANLYGVEVKSTKDDHWTSTGSSILESTRVPGIERIYMTFGKLGGNPIEFLSRPYEECLYDIAVTHMPRYLINMKLKKGETIFDKMGIPYDELRVSDNPFAPISKYYRSRLREGESLWWAGDSGEETVSATIRLWKNVSSDEKKRFTVFGCLNYPEIFGGNYDRYALWLTSQGVVDPHIRDQFSAGGQEPMRLSDYSVVKFPGVYRRIKDNLDYFIHLMAIKEPAVPTETAPVKGAELSKRLLQWCAQVSRNSVVDYDTSMDALKTMLFGFGSSGVPETRSNESLKTCRCCGRAYRQSKVAQKEGFKEREEDICPYCGNSNGSSLEWEFTNRK